MLIRISNLVDSVTEDDVIKLFRKYGPVSELRTVIDRYTSKDLIIVFVNVHDDLKGAKAIVDFHGMVIENEIIEIREVIN